VVECVEAATVMVPLTFANIYETSKINDPARRSNMARTQALISGGRVFRGRRRILEETLSAYIANQFCIPRGAPDTLWFLSDLWFEAVVDYSPSAFDFEMSASVPRLIRQNPASALFDYLTMSDEDVRLEGVRRFSADSADLVAGIESRRAIAAGETLALRKRAYSARVMIDELDFVLATGRKLGLEWHTVRDIGSSMMRSIAVKVPILNAERELAVRLEDQARPIAENDLRDMAAFTAVLPLADIVVGEKQFVNLARQARLDEANGTKLLTSIFDL
jgi:hypothetical protein